MLIPVLISIVANHSHEHEPVELLINGSLCLDAENPFLKYEEIDSLEEAATQTTITFKGNEIYLQKQGATESLITYSKRQWTQSFSNFNGYELNFSVFPHLIEYELSPHKGWLDVQCDMIIFDSTSTSSIALQYKSID